MQDSWKPSARSKVVILCPRSRPEIGFLSRTQTAFNFYKNNCIWFLCNSPLQDAGRREQAQDGEEEVYLSYVITQTRFILKLAFAEVL